MRGSNGNKTDDSRPTNCTNAELGLSQATHESKAEIYKKSMDIMSKSSAYWSVWSEVINCKAVDKAAAPSGPILLFPRL